MDETMLNEMRQLVTVQQDGAMQTRQLVSQMRELMLGLAARIESLERTLATKVTVSSEQSKALSRAIRARASSLCEQKELDEKACGAKIKSAIKKDILTAYGVKDLHDLPAAYFDSAVREIGEWQSYKLLRELRRNGNGA